MTKEELWTAYTAKNPSFNGDDIIHMSAAGLRKFFAETWSRAHEAGFDNGKAWERMNGEKSDSSLDSLRNMFGMK